MRQNRRYSTVSVLLAALLAAGCSQTPPKTTPVAAPGKAPKGGGTATRPKPPRIDGTGAELPPQSVWTSEWSRVGDIRVRLDRVEIRKPTLLSANDTEYEGDNDELVVVVTIENLSTTEPLSYQRWEVGTHSGTKLTDNTGKVYQIRTFSTSKVKGGVLGGKTTLPPQGPPITDVLLFERPVAEADELHLTLGPQTAGEKEGYRFTIPASAW